MRRTNDQDQALRQRRIQDSIRLLRYLRDKLSTLAIGKLASPQKLMVYYAGYTAMRCIWDGKTECGTKISPEQKKTFGSKSDKLLLIHKIEKQVSHPLGYLGDKKDSLFTVSTFQKWANKILKEWPS